MTAYSGLSEHGDHLLGVEPLRTTPPSLCATPHALTYIEQVIVWQTAMLITQYLYSTMPNTTPYQGIQVSVSCFDNGQLCM